VGKEQDLVVTFKNQIQVMGLLLRLVVAFFYSQKQITMCTQSAGQRNMGWWFSRNKSTRLSVKIKNRMDKVQCGLDHRNMG
jgi:hypothetical protein